MGSAMETKEDRSAAGEESVGIEFKKDGAGWCLVLEAKQTLVKALAECRELLREKIEG